MFAKRGIGYHDRQDTSNSDEKGYLDAADDFGSSSSFSSDGADDEAVWMSMLPYQSYDEDTRCEEEGNSCRLLPRARRLLLCSGWNLIQVCLLAAIASIPLHVYFGICSPMLGFLTYSAIALPFAMVLLILSPTASEPPKVLVDLLAWLTSLLAWKSSRSLSPSSSPSSGRWMSKLGLVYLMGSAWSLVVWTSFLGTALFQRHPRADTDPTSRLFSSAFDTALANRTGQGLVPLNYHQDRHHSIFFALNLFNSATVLPSLSLSLLELSEQLGPRNVFISIYESNSQDDTCERLKVLRRELEARGIPNAVRCGQTSAVRYGKEEGKASSYDRINYLAGVRNEALAPLDDVASLGVGVGPFSHVAWLNDIFFDPKDVLTLLDTHGGEFDQVCAIDTVPLGFYDTWVTRDLQENRLKPLWPYFSAPQDIASMRIEEPILVNSCWNGLTIFDASWFTSHSLRPLLLQDAAKAEALSKHNVSLPIRFRVPSEPQCIASECLLSSYDQHLLSAPDRPRIYVNPRVVVSYDAHTHALYHVWSRFWVSRLWLFVWQDLISTRIFGRVTDLGRKKPRCAKELHAGWANIDAELRQLAEVKAVRAQDGAPAVPHEPVNPFLPAKGEGATVRVATR